MRDRVKIYEMDRYLTAQLDVESKSKGGQIVHTWIDQFSFFASQADVTINENFSKQVYVAPATTTFTTHYRTDLNRSMRLKLDGEYWNIIGFTKDKFFVKINCWFNGRVTGGTEAIEGTHAVGSA